MKCRVAGIDDLQKLVDIGNVFLSESKWKWTYSPEHAAKTFYTTFMHPEMDTLIVEDDDGKLLGVSVVCIENDFTVETIGDIVEFYISPEARGTGASRELMKFMCDWFDNMKAVNVFVKSTGNIGESKAFENLFSKYGFNVFSHVLVR